MRPHEAAALAAIDAVYALDILYDGAGLAFARIPAVRSDQAAEAFQGPGNTLREISFEIDLALLPDRPSKSDVIEEVETGERWQPIDITRKADIGRWRLIVEEAES
jgi:hypothetical protein